MPELTLINLRIDAALRGKWNIGFFASGLLFWIYVAIVGISLPLATARIYWVTGTFFIFPVAVVMSKLFKADPFTKGNALGDLVGYTHLSVIGLSFPIIIVTAIYMPQALLLLMSICFCLDFYVMSWAFGTALFGLHAAIRTLAVTIIYFALPAWRLTLLPLAVALLYLITMLMIPPLKTKWLEKARRLTSNT